MPREIERKFLLRNNDWKGTATGKKYRQGYLSNRPECTVRVRTVGDRAFLAIKGATVGATRLEYEYEIPVGEAQEMLQRLCLPSIIEKTRYVVPHADHTWEIDEFQGENRGLLLAEIELESEDEIFEVPGWIGAEVTEDPRYYNASLAAYPFQKWREPQTPDDPAGTS